MTTGTERKVYGAIDLHSTNLWLTVVEADGREVLSKRVPLDLKRVLEVLEPYRELLVGVAVESTFNWYWLVDGLEENGFAVKLANPAAMVQYKGLKRTGDKSDARWIAELFRLGILAEGYIYPKAERPLRDLLRRRLLIVRQRTQMILSLQSMLMRECGLSAKKAELLKWEEAEVNGYFPDEFSQQAALALQQTALRQDELVKELEAAALGRMKLTDLFKRLLTLPGVGTVLGLTICLESGPAARFPGPGNYASYCRAVDSCRESNQKKKGENNRKNGNKYLGWAFVEAANFAPRFDPRIRKWFDRKQAKCGRPVAVKALACKLAKAAYFIMRDEVDYDPVKMFG